MGSSHHYNQHPLVILPCHNEEAGLPLLIEAIHHAGFETLVVDDGSTDHTAQLARRAGSHLIQLESNQGKGAAIRAGLNWASERKEEWVILMDGDGQHAPDDLPRFLEVIQEVSADPKSEVALIVGNRMWDSDRMPVVRRWTNQFMSWALSRRFGKSFPDTQCGFRAIRLSAWCQFPSTQNHYQIESELIARLSSAGLEIQHVEIKTIYKDSHGAPFVSRIHPIRDGWRWVKWFLTECPK